MGQPPCKTVVICSHLQTCTCSYLVGPIFQPGGISTPTFLCVPELKAVARLHVSTGLSETVICSIAKISCCVWLFDLILYVPSKMFQL